MIDPTTDGEKEMIDGNGEPHRGHERQLEAEHHHAETPGISQNPSTLTVHGETPEMGLHLQDRTFLTPHEPVEDSEEVEVISEDGGTNLKIEARSAHEADHAAHGVIALWTR
jgi:hypothetical protein